jgi:hypothetical protein
MAKTPLFPVDGTDIELYEVSKWNRRTIADGNWLNDNNIEPLMDNDIILAKAIAKYGNYQVEVTSDDESISVTKRTSEQDRKIIYDLSINGDRKLAYVNSNKGTSSSELPQSWITFVQASTAELPLPAGEDHIIGQYELGIENNAITGMLTNKQYILSAEVIANVTQAANHEYTVHITADTAPGEVYDFDFRIDGTKVHQVTKSVTWMAQNLDSVKLYMTAAETIPGISFSVNNIFCIEQGGSGSGNDGDGPVYWIGNNGETREVGDEGAIPMYLPSSPDFGGRSIRAASASELSLDSGIYQINAVLDVELDEYIDTLADLEVDFGEGFMKCNTITPKIDENRYSASFSFLKHVTSDSTLMSIEVKVGSTGAEARIKHLGVAKISAGGGSGSSDPTEMQWFRGSSLLGNNIDLPTANSGTSAELVMTNLLKNATNGGTLDVDNGTVVLPDDKIYDWHTIVEVSKDGLEVNTVADIMVTVTGDTGSPHVFYAKMPINEDNIIDVPMSGIARGPGNLQFKFNVALKSTDGESLSAEACNFHFSVKYLEVVAK